MRRMLGWGVVVACSLAGCVESRAVICANGDVCPAGHACVATSAPPGSFVCARPEQVAACASLADGERCDDPGNPDAPSRCYAGACLPIVCGDGLIDPLEVCSSYVPGGAEQECCCGNGVIELARGEACDDGNFVGRDGCHQCQGELAQWGVAPRSAAPSPREAPQLVPDLASGQLVLFGGTDRSGGFDHLADTYVLGDDGWIEPSLPAAPPGRSHHAMAYDVARDHVVLFGGAGSTFFADTWRLDRRGWTKQFPAMSPPARSDHAMAYDARRARVVLFGGLGFGSARYDDTWEWDGTTWTPVELPAGLPRPAARQRHGLAFDPVRGIIVMTGGLGADDRALDDTWEYDGQTWREVTPSAPRPVGPLALAYDPHGRRILGFGGPIGVAGATWSWDGATWTRLTLAPSERPTDRSGAALATHPATGRVTLFGGCSIGGCATQLADTWEWTGTVWAERPQPADSPPPQTIGLAFAYDPLRGRGIAFGGLPTSITRELDGQRWAAPAVSASPPARRSAAMAFDPERAVAILFGGSDATTVFADTWQWDGAAWTELAPAISPPARIGHRLAYDAARGRLVLFGGRVERTVVFADTWEWDGATWIERTPVESPPARSDHILAYDPIRREVVLFGGLSAQTIALHDTWVWDGDAWRQVADDPALARSRAAAIWHGPRRTLLLHGGDAGTALDDAYEWDGSSWQPVLAVGPLASPRAGHALFPDRDGGVIAVLGDAADDRARLRWDGPHDYEACVTPTDLDRDDRAACLDDDCWSVCRPMAPPGSELDPAFPHCGDGTCDPDRETCRSCSDCSCPSLCGDAFCDPDESATSCPGDCA